MEIRHNLTSLTIRRHDHDCDKFSSLAICIKNNIHIRYQQYVQALHAVNFVVKFGNSTLQKNLSFLLVYRTNCSNIQQLVSGIGYFPNTHSTDIILGDLNMNYLSAKDMAPLDSLMASGVLFASVNPC